MKLTKAEELLMSIIWKQEKTFMKDILVALPEPKPAPTTVATTLKRMHVKGFIGFKLMGNSRQYYPLVKKGEYFAKHFKDIAQNHFENSALRFTSFVTSLNHFSIEELEILKKSINKEIKKRKK